MFRSIRRWIYCWLGVFFGLPLLFFLVALLCGVLHWDAPFYRSLVNFTEHYFHFPAMVFGGAHFGPEKVCYLPEDLTGVVLTIGFYLFLALAFSVLLGIICRKRNINRCSEPAPGHVR